ncbi:MAG: 30S ribosomal protein S6 [Campylobacterota bacterium]
MNSYESLFVLKPTLTEEETQEQIAKFESIITSNGGEIVAKDEMGTRNLAYEVEGDKRGFYVVFYMKAPSSLVSELERNYRINESVIKFLTVKFSSKKELLEFDKMVSKVK